MFQDKNLKQLINIDKNLSAVAFLIIEKFVPSFPQTRRSLSSFMTKINSFS